jgi:CO/xanthine dehydrogenase FAD-binding subunit
LARYLKPSHLAEALEILDREPESLPLAGGTDLLLLIRDGLVHAELLVDIGQLESLRGVRRIGEAVEVGPSTPLAELAHHALLPASMRGGAGWVGSPQIRNLGTIGGNVCNASPCGDTLCPLLTLDSVFILRSDRNERAVPAAGFFLGPKKTVRQRNELLVAIRFPHCPERRTGFAKIGGRGTQAIAQVNLALAFSWVAGSMRGVRLAVGSAAPTPIRIFTAEALLEGAFPGEPLLSEVALAIAREIRPICDQRGSADYRRQVVRALFHEALADALGKEGLA